MDQIELLQEMQSEGQIRCRKGAKDFTELDSLVQQKLAKSEDEGNNISKFTITDEGTKFLDSLVKGVA